MLIAKESVQQADTSSSTAQPSTSTQQQSPGPASSPKSVWNDESGLQRVRSGKSRMPLIMKKSTTDVIPESEIEKIVLDNKIRIDSNFKNKQGDQVLVVSSEKDRNLLQSKLCEVYP